MGDETPASATEARLAPVDEIQALRAAACDWRLARGDLGVFAVILEHCNAEAESFPGPALIAKKARLAVTNVKESIKRLEALRYIEVHRPGLRKKNRFKVTFKPMSIIPRLAGMPSQLTRAMAKQKADSSRKHPQSKQLPRDSTRDAGMQPTGYAPMKQLGMPPRHEVAFKSLSEITDAARPFPGVEEQERLQVQSVRREYLEALTIPGRRHARAMEQVPAVRKHIEDLIQERAA